MEEENDLEEIEGKIQELKMKKKKIKYTEDKKLRLRSNNCGKSNVNNRVSINFKSRLDFINKQREENGFDCLSYPKITELIIKHIKCWKTIESDIVCYNTGFVTDTAEGEFNDK